MSMIKKNILKAKQRGTVGVKTPLTPKTAIERLKEKVKEQQDARRDDSTQAVRETEEGREE